MVQVAERRGEPLGRADRRQHQPEVRQHGPAHDGKEVAEDQLEVLARPDIGRSAGVLVGQAVEQDRVDVVADAEGEDP